MCSKLSSFVVFTWDSMPKLRQSFGAQVSRGLALFAMALIYNILIAQSHLLGDKEKWSVFLLYFTYHFEYLMA